MLFAPLHKKYSKRIVHYDVHYLNPIASKNCSNGLYILIYRIAFTLSPHMLREINQLTKLKDTSLQDPSVDQWNK